MLAMPGKCILFTSVIQVPQIQTAGGTTIAGPPPSHMGICTITQNILNRRSRTSTTLGPLLFGSPNSSTKANMISFLRTPHRKDPGKTWICRIFCLHRRHDYPEYDPSRYGMCMAQWRGQGGATAHCNPQYPRNGPKEG